MKLKIIRNAVVLVDPNDGTSVDAYIADGMLCISSTGPWFSDATQAAIEQAIADGKDEVEVNDA